jgi:DNA-binding transcriptional LysR family regulator
MHVSEIDKLRDFPSFGSLKAFELIGRLGGIRKAAIALGIDHAAVSRHLRNLEDWAGTPLLDRCRGESTRLTPIGVRYHTRISAALCEIASAGIDLRESWAAPPCVVVPDGLSLTTDLSATNSALLPLLGLSA